MTTTLVPAPADITSTPRLVLNITMDDLSTTPPAAAAAGTFAAILPSAGLGAPVYVTGTRADGQVADLIVLDYLAAGQAYQRTWGTPVELDSGVSYQLLGDTSSTGYISA